MGEDRGFGAGDDVTWEQLVAAEPRLAWLLAEVRAARPDEADGFELEDIWGKSKVRIADLVGWHRGHGNSLLRTGEVYRLAYDTLLNTLYGELE